MILRKNRSAATLVIIGSFVLAIACGMLPLLTRTGHVGNFSGFAIGLLFGVAIGILFVAVIRKRRGGNGSSSAALLLVAGVLSLHSSATAAHAQTSAHPAGPPESIPGPRSDAPSDIRKMIMPPRISPCGA
jgi:hypothetical protein